MVVTLNEKTRMKTSKDIEFELNQGKDVKIPSMRKIYVLCSVIPFVLFWAGVTSPLWTDNFIVYIFALAPYYLYIILLNNDWIDGRILFDTQIGILISKIWAFNIFLMAVSSLFLAQFWTYTESIFFGVILMNVVNVVPAFISVIAALYLHKTRYARFPLWAPPLGTAKHFFNALHLCR